MRGETYHRRDKLSVEVAIRITITSLQALLITLVTIYSLEVPCDSSGTSHGYQMQNFTIVFAVTHVLLFDKLFNPINLTFSLYKLVVVVGQLVVFYLGAIIISATDTYYYKGILWAFKGKALMTGIALCWMGMTLPALRTLYLLMKKRNLKRGSRQSNSLLVPS